MAPLFVWCGLSLTAGVAVYKIPRIDGDGAVTILDLTVLAQHFLEAVAPATERYKQDADDAITILDLTMMANLFLDNVSVCP